MQDITLAQYLTTHALTFFLGALVGFLGSVFTLATRLPPREPPEDIADALESIQQRRRIHLASRKH